MKHRQYAEPRFTIDNGGRELAQVPLARCELHATLYAEDYRRLMDARWSSCWTLTNTGGRFPYVLVQAHNPRGRKRSLTVARLIAQVGKGQLVSYADGDRLNLRRDNLLIRKGTAWTPVDSLLARKGTSDCIVPEVRQGPKKFTANFREGIELSGRG